MGPGPQQEMRTLPFPPLFETRKWELIRQEFSLTRREIEIASLLSRGAANSEVCEFLGVQGPTVRDHCRALYRKLGCTRPGTHRRLELVLTLVHWSRTTQKY